MRWWRRQRDDEPLDCAQVRRVLQSYLDGELEADRSGLVTAHLELCERCGLDAATIETVKAALAGLDRGVDQDALARLRAFAEQVPGRA